MTERTPTTEYVRRVYAFAPVDLAGCSHKNPDPDYAGAQFYRWLAAHDAPLVAEVERLTAERDEWRMQFNGTDDMAAAFRAERDALAATVQRVRAVIDDAEAEASHPLAPRGFGGEPFPAMVTTINVRAALDGGDTR